MGTVLELIFWLLFFIGVWRVYCHFFCPVLEITSDLPSYVMGRNSWRKVWMVPNCLNWSGIAAQEIYEAEFRHNIINLLRLACKDRGLERTLEIKGHAISLEFVEEDYKESVRAKHAHSLSYFYKCFQDVSTEEIVRLLEKEQEYARGWVKKNINKVDKFNKQRQEYLDK